MGRNEKRGEDEGRRGKAKYRERERVYLLHFLNVHVYLVPVSCSIHKSLLFL